MRYAHCLQKGNEIKKLDKLRDGSRVYCTSLTYRIWSEIDEEDINKIQEVDIVKQINLETKPY